jgi:predicted DNA-binding transcriptional regulator YafY
MKKNPPQKTVRAAKSSREPEKTITNAVSRNMQVFRIARLASLLKKNSCPTAENIRREYESLSIGNGQLMRGQYSLRTVYRDIDALRNEFGCPIKFDRRTNTYYLEDRSWDFNCPANLSESAMLALIIGGRIAEDVFPDPVRGRISRAVDEILKANSPEFLEKTLVSSLKVFAEGGVSENPGVFSTVFAAWQNHQRLHIIYNDQHGGELERDIDPHVLFLYLHEWRIKAYCHLRKAPRTFVINRIRNAWPLKDTFKPDRRIIDSVTLDNIVSYRKVRDVRIRLTGDAVKFANANQMHSRQKVRKNRDGSFLFSIPEVPAEVVVPWILSQKGEAVPIEPPEIVEAVRKGAQATLDSLAK